MDLLAAYWNGDPGMEPRSRQRCRELTAGLLRTVPPAELAAARRRPLEHRGQLERWIGRLLDSGAASRNLDSVPAVPSDTGATPLPSPVPPTEDPGRSAPEAQPRSPGSTGQSITGSQGVAFNIGGPVSGSIQVGAPFPTAPPTGADPTANRDAPPASPKSSPAAAPETIRILFLGANPTDGVRLRLDHEVREIDHALRLADLGGRFELWQKWAVRPTDLQLHLLRHRPDILHFSGHGGPGNAVLLEGDDGATRAVDAGRLARLLAQFNGRLRCVFLNACFSEAQAVAIAREVDCVIGMSSEVLDRAAIRFAANFYQALAFGCSVKAAFELCRADIEVGEMNQDAILRLVAVREDPDRILFVENDLRPQ